jgi:hypothetical protein
MIFSICVLLSIVLIKGVCGLSSKVDKPLFDHLETALSFQVELTGVIPFLN